jgi:hypothetical protein
MNERIYLSSFQKIYEKPKYILFLVLHYTENHSKQVLRFLRSPDDLDWDSAINCVKEILGNLDYFRKTDDIDWESVEMPLMLLFLYQTLPQFKNKLQIEFKGSILEALEHSLSLSNSFHHPIKYDCFLEGSTDFTIKDKQFEISPKSSEILKICFRSRFVRRSEAKLKLISSQIGLNQSSIILASLFSTINELKPVKVLKVESEIYANPIQIIQLSITNIFDQKGSFKVNYRQFKVIN